MNIEQKMLIRMYALLNSSDIEDVTLSIYDDVLKMRKSIEQYFKSRGWELAYADFGGWGICPQSEQEVEE